MTTPRDIEILARTLYGEARGEEWNGKVAVAWVIRNRAEADLGNDGKPDWWGEGIEGVCLAPQQFSCWNKNDPNFKKISEVRSTHPVFRECLGAAAAVLSDVEPDPTFRSKHYCTNALNPAWAKGKAPVAKIGGHKFFNNIA